LSKSSALSKSANLPAEHFQAQELSSDASTPQWKQEVNQRLAAHRNRRGGSQEQDSRVEESPRAASARAAEAAARVAARYAKAPSYSELLAGEARAVVRAAGAAAEAARNAQAAAQAVLAGLESEPVASGSWEPQARVAAPAPPVSAGPARWQDEPPAATLSAYVAAPEKKADKWAGAQPRWEEALPVTAAAPPPGRDVWSEMRVHPTTYSEAEPQYREDYREAGRRHSGRGYSHDSHAARDLEGDLFPEERFEEHDSYDPMGSATIHPVEHLPANLIEFPRELVATRKARPRLAEGPFYDASADSQLSIFEVDPVSPTAPISLGDLAAEAVAPPEWASIELEHREDVREQHYFAAAAIPAAAVSYGNAVAVEEAPARATGTRASRFEERGVQVRNAQPAQAVELLVAPLADRALAAVVDGALVTLAFVAAAVVVIASTAHPPTGKIALIASGVGLLLFGLLYQFLFLSFAEEGTPGMRYARIALCTFEDDNPTLQQMRMRIPALLLSALPVGLGMLWAAVDGDHLGWHDRWTRTYQRKY
jgi:uncharacterized RDD family membrane protein YckC